MKTLSRAIAIIATIFFLFGCEYTSSDLLVGEWDHKDGSRVEFSGDGTITFRPTAKDVSGGAPKELRGEWEIDEKDRLTVIINDTPIVGTVELLQSDSMVVNWDHDTVLALYTKSAKLD